MDTKTISLPAALLRGVAWTLVLAGVFAGLDVALHTTQPTPLRIAQSWLLVGGAAALPALAVATLLWLPARTRGPVAAARFDAALIAVLGVAALSAYVLLGSWRFRGAPGVVLLSAGAGALWLVAAAVGRSRAGVLSLRRASVSLAALAAAVGAGWLIQSRPGPTATFASSPSGAGAPDSARLPNVVVIVLDTLRRDHIGAYGDARGLTPNLDRFAEREAVVYEEAFSPSCWTIPAHATLFTGLPPHSHGCSNAARLSLHSEYATLADVLGASGYQTVALNSNIAVAAANLLQGFADVFPLYGEAGVDRLAATPLAERVGLPEDWVDKGSGEALERLRAWFAGTHDAARPTFLFVNLLEPHEPYLPPWPERAEHLPAGVSYAEASTWGRSFRSLRRQIRGERDPRELELAQALYAASVRYQDRRLGELLELIDARLGGDGTLVVVTADHGENLGAGARWGHGWALNDHLTHVPLVVRYPERADAGGRIGGLCQLADVPATIYDTLAVAAQKTGAVAGLPKRVLSYAGGLTLRPDEFRARPFVFSETHPYWSRMNVFHEELGFGADLHPYLQSMWAVRSPTHRLVIHGQERRELYDLARDPEELRDLLEPGSPWGGVAAMLTAQWREWRAQAVSPEAARELWPDGFPEATAAPTGGGDPQADELWKRLRTLGYAD